MRFAPPFPVTNINSQVYQLNALDADYTQHDLQLNKSDRRELIIITIIILFVFYFMFLRY